MAHDPLDAVKVTCDDERAVCNAGVLLVATLAKRLGLEQWLARACVWASSGRAFVRAAK
jgi:hypothetical protein